jgi:hypothetical protein
MWLWPIFRWFQANPWAQWVAAGVAAYGAFRLWLAGKIRGERKEARKEGREEVIEQIQEKTNEAVQRVEDERRATASLNDAERLRLAAKSPNNRGRMSRPETD